MTTLTRLVRRVSFAASVGAAAPTVVNAQDDVQSRIDSVVKAEMARQKIPGVGVAVIRGSEVMLAKGYGEANVEHHVPVTPETVFQSGSVGKQFTSTAVMHDVVDYRRDYTEEELAQLASKLTPEFPPGSRWNYSNTGYLLLGIIIHKVSGQFYGDVLRERVFTPLGMQSARVISEADRLRSSTGSPQF